MSTCLRQNGWLRCSCFATNHDKRRVRKRKRQWPLKFCDSWFDSSPAPSLLPWYNCNGWVGVKHQVTYLPALYTSKLTRGCLSSVSLVVSRRRWKTIMTENHTRNKVCVCVWERERDPLVCSPDRTDNADWEVTISAQKHLKSKSRTQLVVMRGFTLLIFVSHVLW